MCYLNKINNIAVIILIVRKIVIVLKSLKAHSGNVVNTYNIGITRFSADDLFSSSFSKLGLKVTELSSIIIKWNSLTTLMNN